MHKIDLYSYQLGAADCYCEMVNAGLKKIALSHPCNSKALRDEFFEDFDKLGQEYNVRYYPEDEPLFTDLFPISLNKNRYVVIFYCEDQYLEEYLKIKQDKAESVAAGTYEECRRDIAVRYGKLLGYSDAGIERLLRSNNERE
ncbi:MAG: hypothetical protein IJJ44_06945 [Solobacterium sp.]|nr:hypothetical protein [Solobacterium sp.]